MIISRNKTAALGVLIAAATAAIAGQARAAFTVAVSTGTVSGPDTIYNVSALNTGGTTGTKLDEIDSTITTPGTTSSTALVIQLADLDGDGANDANVTGSGLNTTTSPFTFERIGSYASFSAAFISPSPTTTDPGGTGAPTQSINAAYTGGNVHSLDIAGISSTGGVVANATATIFAHIVVPTGTAFTVAGTVGGDMGTTQAFTVTNASTPTATPLISLTTVAPTGFGSQVGTLALTGKGSGNYNVVTSTFAATNTGYLAVTGFTPATDQEVYGLRVLEGGAVPSPADLATIVADINAAGGTADTNGTVTASLVTGSFAAQFPTDDILLTTAGTTSGSPFLGFNVTTATGITGALTVTSVSAVPEPATLATLALGSVGLLAGRRRRSR